MAGRIIGREGDEWLLEWKKAKTIEKVNPGDEVKTDKRKLNWKEEEDES